MNGADLLLLVNTGTPIVPVYEVVGSQRNCTIEETTAEIDASSKDSRNFRAEPGRHKSTAKLDALFVPDGAAFLALRDAMRNGTKILVARQESNIVVETANAVITSLSETFPDQDMATISCALTIDGEWTEVGT